MPLSIKDLPTSERPREKLLELGAGSLSDAELLAVLLGSGSRDLDVLSLARLLLKKFDGLPRLLAAPQRDVCAEPGIGAVKYAVLQASIELQRRFLNRQMATLDVIDSPHMAQRLLSCKLCGLRYEVFVCLHLDSQNRMIQFEELFRGTLNMASVHPREVARSALEKNTAAVILAHNHPSGLATPSTADDNITRKLREALDLIGVKLLDHIIIGDGDNYSFAEQGKLGC